MAEDQDINNYYVSKKLLPKQLKVILCNIENDIPDQEDVERKRLRKKRILDCSVEEDASIAESVTSSRPQLSAEEIREHYGNCIRLAAENKITAKNAFSLHLIDFLTDMLMRDGLDNFQMASSSLDASAKIYAGRVDRIHIDTYKILSDLGRTRSDEIDIDCEVESEEGLSPPVVDDQSPTEVHKQSQPTVETEESKKRNNNKHNKKKFVILTNVARIRQKYATLKNESDPLFQAQSIDYDEGSTAAIRMNQIFTLNDSCDLGLDSNSTLVGPLRLSDVYKEKFCELPQKFADTFLKLCRKSSCPQICPEFRNYKFEAPKETDKSPTENANLSFEIKRSKKADKFRPPEIDMAVCIKEDGAGDCELPSPFSFQPTSQISEAPSSQIFEQDDGQRLVQGLHNFMSQQIEECGAVKDNTLGSWDGIKMNNNLLPHSNCQNNLQPNKNLSTKAKSSKQIGQLYTCMNQFIIHHENSQFMRIAENKELRLCFHCNPKSKNIMSDAFINDNMKNTHLLPQMSWNQLQELNRFELLLTRDVKVSSRSAIPCEPVDAFDKEDAYFSHDVDIDDINLNIASPEAKTDEGVGFEPALSRQSSGLLDCSLELTAAPMIKGYAKQNVDIPFARVAKSINMRRLKVAIWKLISVPLPYTLNSSLMNSSLISSTSHDSSSTTNSPSKPQSKTLFSNRSVMNSTNLSCVVSDIPTLVPQKMASELSVPIVISCLLHLANENDLCLENSEGFDDIIISQSLPEFPTTVEGSTRKRKSTTANTDDNNEIKKRHSSPINGVFVSPGQLEEVCRHRANKRLIFMSDESDCESELTPRRNPKYPRKVAPAAAWYNDDEDVLIPPYIEQQQQPCCSKSLRIN